MSPLAEAVAGAARALAPAHVEALAAAVEGATGCSPSVVAAATRAVPSPSFQALAQAVLDAWTRESEVPGAAVALALRTALMSVQAAVAEQSVEIVWTGPTTPEVPLRRTDVVLAEVIAAARARLVLVSFAAYKVPSVVAALEDACGRGVDVTLVLETADAGVLSHDAVDAFAGLRHRVNVLVWPLDRRVTDTGTASLHAKCAVADDHTALVTSANLTGAALAHNMELGLLVRGGGVPRRLAALWSSLAGSGELVAQQGDHEPAEGADDARHRRPGGPAGEEAGGPAQRVRPPVV